MLNEHDELHTLQYSVELESPNVDLISKLKFQSFDST